MREAWVYIKFLLLALLLIAGGWAGHSLFAGRPQAVAIAAPEPERELVARGTTVINVLPGAKVITYPGGDFVINAPEGGIEIVQMPQPAQKKKAATK